MLSTSTPRACESCRSLKVRCLPALEGTPASQQRQCQRCAASGNACIYTAPRRTKRKRTDVRVRELEEEVKALGELLKNGKAPGSPGSHAQPLPGREPVQATAPAFLHKAFPISRSNPTLPDFRHQVPDPIGTGILSMQYAAQLLGRYVSDLAPQRPLVVFPPGTPASYLRASKPIVFLAVLTAVAGTLDEKLCTRLNDLLLRTYAEHILIRGEKSLELIQAILVSTNWYFSPDDYDHFKFYQQIHMAATMAIDIGLGDAMKVAELHGTTDVNLASCDSLDRERTLLGCYICCSSISLGFHRQNMFAFTPYVEECLETFETSSCAAPTDAVLAAWVRLQHVIDTSATALGLRSHNSKVDLSDARTQLNLHNATKQLEGWRRNVPESVINDSLLMQYETVLCLLHEICLYDEYDPAEFKPPYSISVRCTSSRGDVSHLITPVHLSSVMTCISSAHVLLDIFLSTSTGRLQCSPVIVYARMGYAVVILLKIYISAVLQSGALHGVLEAEKTEMELYLERVMRKLTDVSAQHCKSAAAWLSIVEKINDWYRNCFIPVLGNPSISNQSGTIEPLRHLAFRMNNGPRTQPTRALQYGQESLPQPLGIDFYTLSHDSMASPGRLSPSHCFPSLPLGMLSSDTDLFSGMAPDKPDEWMDPCTGFAETEGDFLWGLHFGESRQSCE